MTRTICDICGKEMSRSKYADNIRDMNFCISTHGKIWDICIECGKSLNEWMNTRKMESEEDKDEQRKSTSNK